MTASPKVSLKGINKLLKKLDATTKENVIKDSLFAGGLVVAGWSKKRRLSGPRPKFLGRVTGRLANSIVTTTPVKSGNRYFVRIGTNVKYGPTHEFGDDKRNIPPRPFSLLIVTGKQCC